MLAYKILTTINENINKFLTVAVKWCLHVLQETLRVGHIWNERFFEHLKMGDYLELKTSSFDFIKPVVF